MAESGQEIEYLSFDDVCEINRRVIQESGGYFVPARNLANQGALEYALAIIAGPDVYPDVIGKAAALAYHIISRHVFLDGNKRTGLLSAWTLLYVNGLEVSLDASVEDLALDVARGISGVSELEAWLQRHVRK